MVLSTFTAFCLRNQRESSSQTHAIGACGGGRVSSETRRRGPTFALGRRADSWADSSAFFGLVSCLLVSYMPLAIACAALLKVELA